jgi:3-oxoadipate enol-lactonase / 4-carboxymuconolactone decarboxylase
VSAPVSLHHVVSGPAAAPVLVMLHSLGADASLWEPQAPALERLFRVVRCDLRGHGASPVTAGPLTLADHGADLVALLDRLGVARAHVCGLSLGGMVAMWTAAHHPERVARLVLCCTSAQLGPASRWTERATAVRAAGTAAVADDVVARWFTPGFASRRPDVVLAARAVMVGTSAEGYAASCDAIAAMDLVPDLGLVRAPTLVVAGAQDPSTPLPHLERIAAGIAGARLAVVPDAAHLANLEQPERVTELIVSHLTPDAPYDAGLRVRREVLGDAHVDRALAQQTPFTAPFQDFITRVAWGEVWQRPGLDRRTRSCITLAALTTLRSDAELVIHVRGALRNGVTAEEIREVLLHTAIYAGVPAANHAFAIAQRVIAEVEAEAQAGSSKGNPT